MDQALMPIFLGVLLMAVTALMTGIAVAIRYQHQLGQLRGENRHLSTLLETERSAQEEKLALWNQTRIQMADTFAALAANALKENHDTFIKLAQGNLSELHQKAQHELLNREKNIEGLLKPIKEGLEKTEIEIRRMENERKEAYGALQRHLESMALSQLALQSETRNLVTALKRPEVRGQWGEITLKRLVELAGMVEHCDFYPQETSSGDARLRPDMIIRLPDQREIIVDVKTPMDAYLSALEAQDEQQRKDCCRRHAKNIKDRIKELSGKAYWEHYKDALDFVILFIPGDQFLSAALEVERQLIETALQERIILATPTSFIALLRAINYGWRQQLLAVNAEKIKEVGEELYKRLATFAEHLEKIGHALNTAVVHYNKAVGSYDRQIIPGARKFTEMGVADKKILNDLEPLTTTIREVQYTQNKSTLAGNE